MCAHVAFRQENRGYAARNTPNVRICACEWQDLRRMRGFSRRNPPWGAHFAQLSPHRHVFHDRTPRNAHSVHFSPRERTAKRHPPTNDGASRNARPDARTSRDIEIAGTRPTTVETLGESCPIEPRNAQGGFRGKRRFQAGVGLNEDISLRAPLPQKSCPHWTPDRRTKKEGLPWESLS